MILTLSNLIDYLLARGWLTASEVVDGGIAISDCTRRNRNFRVSREKRQGLFIKQARVENPALAIESAATLRIEAVIHQLIRTDPAFAGLAPLLPAFEGFDPIASVLVCRNIDAEDIGQHQRRSGNFSLELAQKLGVALARFHSTVPLARRFTPGAPLDAYFPARMPWMLKFHEMNPQQLPSLSPGTLALHQALGQQQQYSAAMAVLQSQWEVNAFTHGDMKWDNCLMPADPSTGDSRSDAPQGSDVIFVDCELADFGDAAWDAAGILQGYLATWINSMPTNVTDVQTMTALAGVPLGRIQPAVANFWNGYVRELGLHPISAAHWLERTVRYTAVRLIQTAYEYVQSLPDLTPTIRCLCQLAMNMLMRPDAARTTLLGLA